MVNHRCPAMAPSCPNNGDTSGPDVHPVGNEPWPCSTAPGATSTPKGTLMSPITWQSNAADPGNRNGSLHPAAHAAPLSQDFAQLGQGGHVGGFGDQHLRGPANLVPGGCPQNPPDTMDPTRLRFQARTGSFPNLTLQPRGPNLESAVSKASL